MSHLKMGSTNYHFKECNQYKNKPEVLQQMLLFLSWGNINALLTTK